MRAIAILAGLLALAACEAPGAVRPEVSRRQAAELGQETTLSRLENKIFALPVHYKVEDPETGQNFNIRLYVEHHTGSDYEIAVVTTPHTTKERLATYEEYRRAIQARQDEATTRGERVERILQAYYNAGRLREWTGIDERIKFLERTIAIAEGEMDRLSRQITANEQVPADDPEKNQYLQSQISVWMKELYDRKASREKMLVELEELIYQRTLREQQVEAMSRPARR